ncbi:MAG: hypothetical protein JWM40_2206 [Frankiales bacterium]|nr:hypothetical protein [Frankiales bacterium]
MTNGTMAVFTDVDVVLEISGGADQWGREPARALAGALTQTCTEAQVCIARPDAELLGSDHALWADLREELGRSSVALLPLIALPAA